MFRTRLYRDGELKAENFPMADVSDHLEDPANVVWVDLCEPDTADLAAIAEELRLHRLAVEDAVHRAPAAQARPLPRPPVPHRLRGAARRRRPAGWSPPRSPPSSRGTRSSRSASDESFAIDDVVTRWDGSPDLPVRGVGVPPARACWTSSSTATSTAVQALDDGSRSWRTMLFDDRPRSQEVQRRSVRDAQEPGPAAPRRAADARGRELPDAPRPARRRRRR